MEYTGSALAVAPEDRAIKLTPALSLLRGVGAPDTAARTAAYWVVAIRDPRFSAMQNSGDDNSKAFTAMTTVRGSVARAFGVRVAATVTPRKTTEADAVVARR